MLCFELVAGFDDRIIFCRILNRLFAIGLNHDKVISEQTNLYILHRKQHNM